MKGRTKFLSREDAIELLQDIVESDILKEELSDGLEELIQLIRHELDGEHFWNQPYSAADKLGVAYREDLWTPELIAEVEKQHTDARFTPAPNEIEDLKAHYMELYECDEESDEEFKKQCEDGFARMYGLSNNT